MPNPKHDPQDWLKGCTCFRLRRTSRRMTQIYDAHLAAVGLTLTQYSLLAHLVRMEPPTVHGLADVMGMDRTTLTRNLKPLLARALLTQQTGEDRRRRLICVTEAGQGLWKQAKPLWQAAQDEIQQRLGDQDTAALHHLLDDTFNKLAVDENAT